MNKLSTIERVLPKLRALASPCKLCARECAVDRHKGEKGACDAARRPCVYSYSPHHGEEPPLSGVNGSGTIFFAHCNMKCLYCQNHTFSQGSGFEEIEIDGLAERMLKLQRLGCHNINLVSPTHYASEIVEALGIALKKSLAIPIVYNTGGYDSVELIKLLDGIVDIYLPDARYHNSGRAKKYSFAPRYAENNRRIIREMSRQAGALKLDEKGIAQKGIIVRLLILPNNISGTIDTLRFLKESISDEIYISVMSQYHPTYKAKSHPQITRRITQKEYETVVKEVENLGFKNGWIQGLNPDHNHFLGTNIKPIC
ncbi:MAG: radical SAM protein [Omnitrophica bacterium]|nr:radical SAM protein [Candidatus Omnitrophota bacterium]